MVVRALPQTIIAGAGPAGLALAAELGARGVAVEVHAPSPHAPWPNSYGAWEQGLRELRLEDAVLRVFDSPRVVSATGTQRTPRASYCRMDSTRLQRNLLERARNAGVRLVAKTHSADSFRSNQRCLYIDATGGALQREAPRFDSYQTAYGLWLDVPPERQATTGMTLMDFEGENGSSPSFLYAMNEGRTGSLERLFVQETILSSRRVHPLSDLRNRLLDRLRLAGIPSERTLGEERCVIPLGRDLPNGQEGCLPFGASAAMVHPATGYQLSHALQKAAPTAEAIAHNLSKGVEQASLAGLEAIWPDSHRLSWKLYRWSASVLREMNREEIGEFVESFFGLPTDQWLGFMEGTLRPGQILSALGGVFGGCSSRLRLRLIRSISASGTGIGRLLLAG